MKITSDPNEARVIMDGMNIGTTPLSVNVSPGGYNLKVERNGILVKKYITVTSDGKNEFHVSLPPRTNVTPNYKVSNEGQVPQLTPIIPAIPDISTNPSRATVYPNDINNRFSQRIRPASRNPAIFELNSTPKGAAIYVDDKNMGFTPSIIEIQPGDHCIIIKYSDYKIWTMNHKFVRGERLNQDIQLRKEIDILKIVLIFLFALFIPAIILLILLVSKRGRS